MLPDAALPRRRPAWPLLLVLLSGPAHAIDVHGFTLLGTSGDPGAWTRLGQVTLPRSGSWAAGVVFDYADDPLREVTPWGRVPVVDALGTANLSAAWSFGGLGADLVMPVHVVGVDQSGSFFAAGDARLGVTVPGWREGKIRPGFATQVHSFFPTGADEHDVGSSGPRVGVAVLFEKHFGRLGLLASLGAEVSPTEIERNLAGGFGPMGGFGAAVQVSDALSFQAELAAQTDLSQLPLEAGISARTRLDAGAWGVLGGAVGLNDQAGAATWRAFAGVGWSYRRPAPVAALSLPVEDPDADRDGDGIRDADDRCKDQAETFDGIDDEDGCPELDGDRDGVPFERDQCPGEPIRPEQDPRWSDGCPKVAEFAGDRIVITEAIFFEEGRATLLPSAEKVLEAVRAVMEAHPEIEYFLVEGHTNTNGSDAYNARLSDARAFTVASWLGQHGIPAARLLSKGFGEARPLVPGEHPDALRINRRVEFRVVSVEQIPADARHLELPPEITD